MKEFAKLKALFCARPGRTREALLEAMARALDPVTARDDWGFFQHCGYRAVAQLL